MRGRKSLIVGIFCGVVCVVAILLYTEELYASVEEERSEVIERYGGEQVEVYVATRDITAGETVGATNVEKRLWVGELLPEDAVFDLSEVEGKTLASTVYSGEVISLRRFEEGSVSTLQVPEGLCAVSVPAESVSTVGGSVQAGSTVDVYATSGTATARIASSVLVLSTSATTGEGEQESTDVTWVTLAVEPSLVEELIAASQKTELYFVIPSDSVSDSQEILDVDDSSEEGDEDTDESTDEDTWSWESEDDTDATTDVDATTDDETSDESDSEEDVSDEDSSDDSLASS